MMGYAARRQLARWLLLSAELTISGLTLIRGDRCLFSGVSFAVSRGELVLLEGDNGSGKTSLLRAVVGLLEPESGDISWNGRPVREVRSAFFSAMVWMGHRVGFKADLTVEENLAFERALRPTAGQALDATLERLSITRLRKLPLRALSAGQQRRVALARMLLASATLWLMDEPFTNLDREGRALVESLVAEHLDRGGMCVMAAHQDVDIDVPTARVRLG